MKRRSARPFTVEVKHTRTSRAALADATARSRKGPDLWRGLPLIADEKPAKVVPAQHAPVGRATPIQPEVPARRVLPSLVPTFAMPAEPEGPEERAALADERLPRVRRPKQPTKREQTPAAQVFSTPSTASKSAPQSRIVPVVVAPAVADVPTVIAHPAPAQGRAARRNQQAAALRPGERWKRRLPSTLW